MRRERVETTVRQRFLLVGVIVVTVAVVLLVLLPRDAGSPDPQAEPKSAQPAAPVPAAPAVVPAPAPTAVLPAAPVPFETARDRFLARLDAARKDVDERLKKAAAAPDTDDGRKLRIVSLYGTTLAGLQGLRERASRAAAAADLERITATFERLLARLPE